MSPDVKTNFKQNATLAAFVAGAMFASQVAVGFLPFMPQKMTATNTSSIDSKVTDIMMDQARTISEVATLLKASQANMTTVANAIIENQKTILNELRNLERKR